MHQPVEGPGDEAVRNEEVFLDIEARVAALQVAGAVAPDPMTQRQVLRSRRSPDRVGLHEPQSLQGAAERGRREQAAPDGEPAQIVE